MKYSKREFYYKHFCRGMILWNLAYLPRVKDISSSNYGTLTETTGLVSEGHRICCYLGDEILEN